jgi:hypothetical protein
VALVRERTIPTENNYCHIQNVQKRVNILYIMSHGLPYYRNSLSNLLLSILTSSAARSVTGTLSPTSPATRSVTRISPICSAARSTTGIFSPACALTVMSPCLSCYRPLLRETRFRYGYIHWNLKFLTFSDTTEIFVSEGFQILDTKRHFLYFRNTCHLSILINI